MEEDVAEEAANGEAQELLQLLAPVWDLKNRKKFKIKMENKSLVEQINVYITVPPFKKRTTWGERLNDTKGPAIQG